MSIGCDSGSCARRAEASDDLSPSCCQSSSNSGSGTGSCCQLGPRATDSLPVAIAPSAPCHLDDLDAAFDSIVFLEDSYMMTGRDAGQRAGEKMGLEEGFDFGWVKFGSSLFPPVCHHC